MATLLTNLSTKKSICVDKSVLSELYSIFTNKEQLNEWIKHPGTFFTFNCIESNVILVLSYEENINSKQNEFKIRILSNSQGIDLLKKYLDLNSKYVNGNSFFKIMMKSSINNANNALKNFLLAENKETITDINKLYMTLYNNYLMRPDLIQNIKLMEIQPTNTKIKEMVLSTMNQYYINLNGELSNILNSNQILNEKTLMDKLSPFLINFKSEAIKPPKFLSEDEKKYYIIGINLFLESNKINQDYIISKFNFLQSVKTMERFALEATNMLNTNITQDKKQEIINKLNELNEFTNKKYEVINAIQNAITSNIIKSLNLNKEEAEKIALSISRKGLEKIYYKS